MRKPQDQNPPAEAPAVRPDSWASVEIHKAEKAILKAAKRIVPQVVADMITRSRNETERLTVPMPAGETFESSKDLLQQAGREATPQSTVRVKPAVIVNADTGEWKESTPEEATHVSFVAGPKVGAAKAEDAAVAAAPSDEKPPAGNGDSAS